MSDAKSTTTLLVIDDDPDVLRATARILLTAGYHVITGCNAAQAIELTYQHRPALLLLDVMLPDGNGVDVARQLKGNAALAGVFVILVSGLKTSGQDQAEGLTAGLADGYITRPFSQSEFLARIDAMLRLRSAQELLREALGRLSKLASRVPGLVYQFRLRADGSSCFPYASEAIRDIYRVSPEQVREDASKMFAVLHPDDYDAVVASIHASARELSPWRIEYRVKFEDHTVRWLFGDAVPEREANGATLWHGFITDITERKGAETELELHRHQLQSLVLLRTAELAKSRDAAQAANRAKSVFLANMSHELRTPMNGIVGMSAMALRRATDPKQIDQLNKAMTAARQLSNTVDNILDIANLEAEELTLQEDLFSLRQTIDETLLALQPAAKAKGLKLSIELAPALPDQLFGDAARLRQALMNFVDNAIKFSEHGIIRVRVAAEQEDTQSLLLRLDVSDQGIGLSAEQQSGLFQAFTQADNSMTRQYGGSGLGLFLSRRISKLMGGDVGIESELGRGATFWLTARLKRRRPEALLPPSRPGTAA
jgi:PAS domain S-box-containing protein